MKLFSILLGCFFISFALFLMIIYFNLLVIGYTFIDFVYFIIRSPIIWLLVIGLLLICYGMGIINELLLRFKTKFSKK